MWKEFWKRGKLYNEMWVTSDRIDHCKNTKKRKDCSILVFSVFGSEVEEQRRDV